MKSLTRVVVCICVLFSFPRAGTAAPFAYITNGGSNSVSVIDTATDTVTATVAVGTNPFGVAVHPDGSRVYVANVGSSTVSVIDTATNTVIATVVVGFAPEEYLHLIEKSGFPKVVTLSDAKDNKKTKKINARSGPGAFGNAYGVVGKAEEGSYTALSNVPGATPDPTCNSGWYQIQHANNDCSVIGNCFAPNDASTKSSVPEAWVCGDFVQE